MSTLMPCFMSFFNFFASLCYWWLVWPIQNNAKYLKTDWNPGIWILIWEYSVRAIQWIPMWQGSNGFQTFLRPCALDESSLSIGRVNQFISSMHKEMFKDVWRGIVKSNRDSNVLSHISQDITSFLDFSICVCYLWCMLHMLTGLLKRNNFFPIFYTHMVYLVYTYGIFGI